MQVVHTRLKKNWLRTCDAIGQDQLAIGRGQEW